MTVGCEAHLGGVAADVTFTQIGPSCHGVVDAEKAHLSGNLVAELVDKCVLNAAGLRALKDDVDGLSSDDGHGTLPDTGRPSACTTRSHLPVGRVPSKDPSGRVSWPTSVCH